MYIFFDTETTGLPKNYNAPINDLDNWPRIVQLAWQVYDSLGDILFYKNFIIKPDGFDIPYNSYKIHGISTELANSEGKNIEYVINLFIKDVNSNKFLIGHNLKFDIKIISSELIRLGFSLNFLNDKTFIDTQIESTKYCNLKLKGKYKWPTLSELYKKLFGLDFLYKHNAIYDVDATAKCFFELLRLGIISEHKFNIDINVVNNFRKKNINISNINISNIKIYNKKKLSIKKEKKILNLNSSEDFNSYKNFSHIHNHTCFSILSATTSIKSLIDYTINNNMPAVGITDYGNMMGSFYFLDQIKNYNSFLKKNKKSKKIDLKGVIGCEFFISENYLQKKFTKQNPDIVYNQVLLAKNKDGYRNLSRLCSKGFIYGYYSGIPRINKELIISYKENLIALSGDLNSEIPYIILNKGKIEGEKIFLWWLKIFKNDFYIELLRHNIEEENYVNKVLIEFSKKYGVKYIPQNNTFYLKKEDSQAHDILLCVKNGEKKSTPIGNGRGFRFGFKNNEFYFKSSDEMKKIFFDLPESFNTLKELLEKIDNYELTQTVSLPKYKLPEKFENYYNKYYLDDKISKENVYLKYLTYKGAKKRYKILSDNIKKRIEFELKIIKKIGYPGYFLIVQDFIIEALRMNISVGPGRGSVAGSIVAYCIGITQLDPIKYNLLFERFLNPDRISLPDIDIDFDDKGRDYIIKWVLDKYGKNNVAQIITYGTMAAKSAIRDTSRVLGLPLYKTNYITKMIPNNISLREILFHDITIIKKKLNNEIFKNIILLRNILKNKNSLENEVLIQASIIEGSLRNTGIHPCGIIISPLDIQEHTPVSVSKDSELLVTQFDNNAVEKVGLLKIDFLGLKTLSIIKDTINLCRKKYKNFKNSFSLEDKKTYELFQKGETIAVFQYESFGMQKYLKQLKPDKFEDLIAMNALYRPGPMQYIPNFISRKNGKEKISYDLPEMEYFLKNTYGITIYQEQVMLLSQKLAGFTKGEADMLRKAMSKKEKITLDNMKNKFLEGGKNNGFSIKILEKIWNDWKNFSLYAFNKSHSTCYAFIAFKTAYLKAHYTAEYMSSVLSNNMNNIKDINFFINECKRMKIMVLNPDINESENTFIVNNSGFIRFGMIAIKGLGEMASNIIIQERKKNGKYISIFDFITRVDLRIINKKTLENLILSGSFNKFNIHHAQYFHKENDISFLEKIIQHGLMYKKIKQKFKFSLFNNISDIEIKTPTIPNCNEWDNIYKLSKEKDVLGVYVTSHPLDPYYYEINKYKNSISLENLINNENKFLDKKINIYGIVNFLEEKISYKTGKSYIIFLLEDYNNTKEFILFDECYKNYKDLIFINSIIYIKLQIVKTSIGHINNKIIEIYPLKGFLKNIIKALFIRILIKDIDEYTINRLEKIFQKYPGNKKIIINVYDKNKNININLISKKYYINIEKKLLDDINIIKKINFYLI